MSNKRAESIRNHFRQFPDCPDRDNTASRRHAACPVRTDPFAQGMLLTAVENGGAGRSKMVALGGVGLS